MSNVDKLEELVGTIKNKNSRDELDSVLNRLVLIGVEPEEATLLLSRVFTAVEEELHVPWFECI